MGFGLTSVFETLDIPKHYQLPLSMAQPTTDIILNDGVPFELWRSSVLAKLATRDLVGYVFHNEDGFRPKLRPEEPRRTQEESSEKFARRFGEYEASLRNWARGEVQAYQTLIDRLDPSLRPAYRDNLTAKKLFEEIAESVQKKK